METQEIKCQEYWLTEEALSTLVQARWAGVSAAGLYSQPDSAYFKAKFKNTGGYTSWAIECGRLLIYTKDKVILVKKWEKLNIKVSNFILKQLDYYRI